MDHFINPETRCAVDPGAAVARHIGLAGMLSPGAADAFFRTALRVCFSAYVINTNAARNRLPYSAMMTKREGPAGSRERLRGWSGAAPGA